MDLDVLFGQLAISAATVVGKGALSAVGQFAMLEVKEVIRKHRRNAVSKEEFFDVKNDEESSTDRDGFENQSLAKKWSKVDHLHWRLQFALEMIAPGIHYCEMRALQGNTMLSRALELVAPLRKDIDALLHQVKLDPEQEVSETKIAEDLYEQMNSILENINHIVPYLNLALTASSISQRGLNSNKSVSRLLQASSILGRSICKVKEKYLVAKCLPVTLYTLFESSHRSKQFADWTWKEDFAKAHCFLVREDRPDRVSYNLTFVEDLCDGRMHSEAPKPLSKDSEYLYRFTLESGGREQIGRVLTLPLANLSKIYYSFSGQLLRIPDSLAPVLILKSLKELVGDTVKSQTSDTHVWIAVEQYMESGSEVSSDGESSSEDDVKLNTPRKSKRTVSKVSRRTESEDSKSGRVNISVLDSLLRLAAVEVAENCSHLSLSDETLSLYLDQFSGTPNNCISDSSIGASHSNLSTPSGDCYHPGASGASLTTPLSSRAKSAINQPVLSPLVKSKQKERSSESNGSNADADPKKFLEKLRAAV